MRIAFVIPSLGPGGAERVASLLCNSWTDQGHAVSVATFEPEGTAPFYDLVDGIGLHQLAIPGGRRSAISSIPANLQRIVRLRSCLRPLQPDIVVAFTTDANVLAVGAAAGLRLPVVISERNQPERAGLGSLHRLARRLAYGRASAIVVQTEPIAAWMRGRFRVPVRVLPNPVSLAPDQKMASGVNRAEEGPKELIAIGRLTRQKGFDVLIRSFALIAGRHPAWRLSIYGEGPDRAQLERLRAETGVADRIALPGLRRDIGAVLAASNLFVLSSRFEGYPNALLEALAAGLPVIATSCPGGAEELLAGGEHGVSVPPDDIAALAAALDRMMSAPALREHYADQARRAVARLDVTSISRRWIDLFSSLRRGAGP